MLGVTLALLIGLLALAIPVAAVLGILGLALSALYSKLPLSLAMGEIAWGTSNNFLLVAIPFFVLLGEILLRSGMAERMYGALVLWIPWLPGGLMHSNIAACAMFAATSGSSVATAATIGTVALNEVEKHGYSERLFLGTIAAGGTLGILILPQSGIVNLAGHEACSTTRQWCADFHAAIWAHVSCRHARKASARARRYRAAVIRCRRGRKWPWIMACADRNRCARSGDLNRCICRSRRRVGPWEFSALLLRWRLVRCRTSGRTSRFATP